MFLHNSNFLLRNAVNINDASAMLVALQLWGANVNHASPDSGLTVLHRAAANGHLNAVKLLIDHGAELDVLSKKTLTNDSKTPYDLAIENNHHAVADYLMLALIAHDAKIYAQKFFNRCEKNTSELEAYRNAQGEFVASSIPDVIEMKKAYSLTPSELYYYESLYDVTGALIVANEKKFYTGFSGEYARAAACYLLEHLPGTGINVSIEHILLTHPNGAKHAFLVLGRNDRPINRPNTWVNALICDPDPSSSYNIFSSKKITNTPLEAIVSGVAKTEVLFNSVRPQIHPSLIDKFTQKEIELRHCALEILYAKTGEPLIREHVKPSAQSPILS